MDEERVKEIANSRAGNAFVAAMMFAIITAFIFAHRQSKIINSLEQRIQTLERKVK